MSDANTQGNDKARNRFAAAGTAIVVVALLVMPMLTGSYWTFSLGLSFANAIAVLSISLLVRYTGEISIGHSAFVAVGAYTVALCERYFGMSLLLSLPCAVLLGAVLGAIFAYPSRYLSGIYLAVVTMALALALPEVLLHFSSVTGGYEGVYAKLDAVPGISPSLQRYYLPLAVLIVVVYLLKRFRTSRQAMALLLAKSSLHAAESLGIRRSWARLSCMALSAGLAALAGSLTAFTAASVSPNSFTLWTSIYLLVGAVISLYSLTFLGSLIGALFLTIIPLQMAGFGDWIAILYGGALLVFILIANHASAIRAMLPGKAKA